MSKYRLLAEHLGTIPRDSWSTTFEEIEAVLGFPLPASAYNHNAWWANQTKGNHSQSVGWRSVGWKTSDIDLDRRKVTFVKDPPLQNQTDNNHETKQDSSVRRLTISEAKAGLAMTFGVSIDAIEITIRG